MTGKRQKQKILEWVEACKNNEDEETKESIEYKDDNQSDVIESANDNDALDEINETSVGMISNVEDGELKADEREETPKSRKRAALKNSGNQGKRSMANRVGDGKRETNIKDGGKDRRQRKKTKNMKLKRL
uniref:Uncharacterized protein n=1 Tax=Glossina palpalis gambiensis TaxID=67801 RepID=A0A1B0BKW3_9MUSC